MVSLPGIDSSVFDSDLNDFTFQNEFSFNRFLTSENIDSNNICSIKSILSNRVRDSLATNMRKYKPIIAVVMSNIRTDSNSNKLEKSYMTLIDLNSSQFAKLLFPSELSSSLLSSFGAIRDTQSDNLNHNVNSCKPRTLIGLAILVLKPENVSIVDENKCEFEIHAIKDLIILGKVKYYGLCESLRKNGEPCKIPVDTSLSLTCAYHSRPQHSSSNNSDKTSSILFEDYNLKTKNQVLLSKLPSHVIPIHSASSIGSNNSSLSKAAVTSHNFVEFLGLPSNSVSRKSISDNNDGSSVKDQSVFEFAASMRLKKLKDQETSILGVQSTPKSNNAVTNTNSISVSIPSRQTSKLGSKAVMSSANNMIQTLTQHEIMKDNTRMVGGVLVDTQILNKNARILTARHNNNDLKSNTVAHNQKQIESQHLKKKLKLDLDLEIDELLSRKSKHSSQAESELAEVYDKRIDKLIAREKYEEKVAIIHSIVINGYFCLSCNLASEKVNPLCQTQHLHQVEGLKLLKRFYECGKCRKRTFVLLKHIPTKVAINPGQSYENKVNHNKRKSDDSHVKSIQKTQQVADGNIHESLTLPKHRCQCGAFEWKACGKHGSSAYYGGSSGKEEKLVLCASEWASASDVDALNSKAYS